MAPNAPAIRLLPAGSAAPIRLRHRLARAFLVAGLGVFGLLAVTYYTAVLYSAAVAFLAALALCLGSPRQRQIAALLFLLAVAFGGWHFAQQRAAGEAMRHARELRQARRAAAPNSALERTPTAGNASPGGNAHTPQ